MCAELSPIGRDTLPIERRIILSLDVAVDTAKVVPDAIVSKFFAQDFTFIKNA